MSQKNHHTSWLLLLLLLLGSKPITIAQTLLQRNYSGLPDGAQQNLHSEASRLTDLVNAYFRTTGFQVLDVGLYDLSLNMQGEQSFDVAFQTADAEVQGQAIPAARQPILRSKLNLNAYLLMVWQVAADGRSLKLRWKLRLPDNGTIPPAELLELESILTGMGSQVAEQQMASLGLGKWAEAAGDGVKKIADLLERKMRGEDVLVEAVYLTKIEFKGFIPIQKKTNPLWMQNKPGDQTISDPLCYARSSPMELLPELSCAKSPGQGRIQLKIKYDNYETLPINLKYDEASKTLKVKSEAVSFVVDTKVNYFNAFKIEWLVNFGKSDQWIAVGVSKHELFITLAAQKDDFYNDLKPATLYFGCTQGKNTNNEVDFIKAVWAPFEAKTLNLQMFKPDKRPTPLTYYRTADLGCSKDIENQTPIEVETVKLVNGKSTIVKDSVIDGQCKAFANLFSEVLANNGVSNNVKFTDLLDRYKYDSFIIQDWSFEFPFFGDTTQPFPYRNLFVPNTFGVNGLVTPRARNNVYNWVQGSALLSVVDQSGVPGQNVANPYSDFENHVFVMIGNELYDPSYGLKFNSFSEWANNSIAGFTGKPFPAGLNGYYYFIAEPSDKPLTKISNPK